MAIIKLTWHFQKLVPDIVDIVSRTPVEWVKLLDPPSQNPLPGKKIIGRHYIPDGQVNDMIMRGAVNQWFDMSLPAFRLAPYVHCWELPNEPPVATPTQRSALVDFSLKAIDLMHAEGLKTVALCFSMGNPPEHSAKEFIPVLEATDYWAMHEYKFYPVVYKSTWDSSIWYSLRHRLLVAELSEAGFDNVPPLLITETGIEPGGWKKLLSREGYKHELLQYDSELQKDSYVKCATIFTSGPEKEWRNFDFDKELSLWLQSQIRESYPESYPDIKPSEKIREAAWNQLGVRYNPEAALARRAREMSLGAPVTNEFDYDSYRVQGFVNGILYCRIGDWNNIKFLQW